MHKTDAPGGTGDSNTAPELRPGWGETILRWLLVGPMIGLGFLGGVLLNGKRLSGEGDWGPIATFAVPAIGVFVGVAFGCGIAPAGKRWVGWCSGWVVALGSLVGLAAASLFGGREDAVVRWAGLAAGGIVAAVVAWRTNGRIDLR